MTTATSEKELVLQVRDHFGRSELLDLRLKPGETLSGERIYETIMEQVVVPRLEARGHAPELGLGDPAERFDYYYVDQDGPEDPEAALDDFLNRVLTCDAPESLDITGPDGSRYRAMPREACEAEALELERASEAADTYQVFVRVEDIDSEETQLEFGMDPQSLMGLPWPPGRKGSYSALKREMVLILEDQKASLLQSNPEIVGLLPKIKALGFEDPLGALTPSDLEVRGNAQNRQAIGRYLNADHLIVQIEASTVIAPFRTNFGGVFLAIKPCDLVDQAGLESWFESSPYDEDRGVGVAQFL